MNSEDEPKFLQIEEKHAHCSDYKTHTKIQPKKKGYEQYELTKKDGKYYYILLEGK